MKTSIALTDFKSVMPEITMEQADVLDYMSDIHNKAGSPGSTSLIKRYGIKPDKIAKRSFESIEIGARGADINERALFFGERARKVFKKFYAPNDTNPDHIIHVTCTGYISPSPAQYTVNDYHWSGKTNVTHAYHMGCYAAMPAVRMAQGFVAAGENTIDVVHTEMCGLHLKAGESTPEQLVVQSLFADGHIKYSAVSTDQATSGFKVLCIREQIVENSQEDMSWAPAPWGMKMTLSREVPEKIGSSLRSFISNMLQSTDYNLHDILKKALFAIHPGGPKIIDSVQQQLELSENQVRVSRDVLYNRGNMSSATLPHVWKQLLDEQTPSGTLVVSLAFGPGLTIFGSVFQVI